MMIFLISTCFFKKSFLELSNCLKVKINKWQRLNQYQQIHWALLRKLVLVFMQRQRLQLVRIQRIIKKGIEVKDDN